MASAKACLYVLRYVREGHGRDCFKVGITDDPARRRREHEGGALDGWVRTVSFSSVAVPDPARAGEVELTATMRHIAAHGFRYVRGSLFDHAKQAHWPRWVNEAYRLVASVLNVCYKCHGAHVVSRCGDAGARAYFLEHGVRGVDAVPRRFVGEGVALARHRRRLDRLNRLLEWGVAEAGEAGSDRRARSRLGRS
jgi:hypothetical protein